MKSILHTTRCIAVAAAMLLPSFAATAAPRVSETTPGLIWSAINYLEYSIDAGVSLGGASPLPLPAEIRSIDSFNPLLNLYISGSATKWFGERKNWGMMLTLRLEDKGMKTRSTVKNYGMEIIRDGSRVAGNWTGGVQTRFRASYLTVPVMCSYKINDRFNVRLGPYVSWKMNGEFSGVVYDGYLREGNPTGNKIEFDGDTEAAYDFSDDLRSFQWGAVGGVTWQAFKHLHVNADLSWGFNGIFKSSFKTVSFGLYPIYLNVGFGYRF